MSFLFASSHLPEVEHPADEEEEPSAARQTTARSPKGSAANQHEVQPMPRSGMVRAFSHLPQPVRRVPGDPAGPRPSAPAFRPVWAAAPEAPSSHAPADGHEPEPDDDADDGHGSSASTGTHGPEDSRPWYLPHITHADLKPEGGEHDAPAPGSAGRAPKKWEPEHDPDPGFDGTPPKEWGKPTRDSGFEVTAPKEWGKPTRDPGFGASPLDVHNSSPAPDTTAAAPAARSAALPYGRLFEKRPTPGFQAPATGRPGFNDLVYRQPPQDASSPAPARPKSLADIPGSTFQQVAAKTGAQQQQYAQLSQSSPPARPASAMPSSPLTPAQGSRPTPPAQREAAAPQKAGAGAAPQGAGSLAKYRQQKQLAEQQLEAAKKSSPGKVAALQTKIASLTRNMESIELAAHLINHTKQQGEADIDPESIDEDSDEYKNKARTAISRLHGGSAPWMDHLAGNFGEKEGIAGGGENPRIKDLFKRVGAGTKNTNKEPWCGHALNDAMTKSGIKAPKGAGWAGSWREWGKHGSINVGDVYHINYPPPDGGGHVTTVVGVSKDGTQVFCLGGNQNGALNISAYPAGEFKKATVAYRKPSGQKNSIPAPTFDYNADPASFGILSGLTR